MPASSKTRFIAEESLRNFFVSHPTVYYWTFTLVDLCNKTEAERRFKPFKDLIARRGKEMLEFWELQERGAWHVHLVTDAYLDVNWLRPWMVARQWGPQMKVKRVQSPRRWIAGEGWVLDDREAWGLVKYLLKYLTKCFREGSTSMVAAFGKKKVFGGTRGSRIGTTRFAWNPKLVGKPGAMFYHYGRQLFIELWGRKPVWKELWVVLSMGYELTDWESFDPFYQPP